MKKLSLFQVVENTYTFLGHLKLNNVKSNTVFQNKHLTMSLSENSVCLSYMLIPDMYSVSLKISIA